MNDDNSSATLQSVLVHYSFVSNRVVRPRRDVLPILRDVIKDMSDGKRSYSVSNLLRAKKKLIRKKRQEMNISKNSTLSLLAQCAEDNWELNPSNLVEETAEQRSNRPLNRLQRARPETAEQRSSRPLNRLQRARPEGDVWSNHDGGLVDHRLAHFVGPPGNHVGEMNLDPELVTGLDPGLDTGKLSNGT